MSLKTAAIVQAEKDAMLEMVREGTPISIAREAAGVAASTLSEWLSPNERERSCRFDPEFAEALTRAKHQCIAKLCKRLMASKDDRVIMWYLERQAVDEFGQSSTLETLLKRWLELVPDRKPRAAEALPARAEAVESSEPEP
jgi:hypothetical protein